MPKLKLLIKDFLLIAIVAAPMAAMAEVQLPSLFGDGMVVQRNQPVKVWGKADAGERVNVTIDKKHTGYAVADEAGNWEVQLAPLNTGKKYTIKVNDIEIEDVVVGDVLLCSGQSNMELPVGRVTDMFADEIAAFSSDSVRMFTVPHAIVFDGPQFTTPSASWQSAKMPQVMGFSALAYFTAKDLMSHTGLPVGIVNACWGGTPVEAWTSEETLAEYYPYAVHQKAIYDDVSYREALAEAERANSQRWNGVLYGSDLGYKGEKKWYDPTYDDSEWTEVDLLSTDWATDGMNPINGCHWFRKEFNVPAQWTGKEAVLRLGCIVDADSVYVNGEFVGTVSYQYPPRIYKLPAGLLHEGANQVTVRLVSNGGTPHFVAEKPYKVICEGDEVSLEGNWKYRLGTRMPSAPGSTFLCYLPAVLYNGMLAPVVKYPVAGAVWYQGESNVGRSNQYGYLLGLMVNDWRNASGNGEQPFYIVELADFLHPSDVAGRNAWAEMRKVQAQAANDIPNARLIPNSDLGEWNDIHPLDKKTLGQRVSSAVLNDLNSNNNKKN